MDKYDRKQALGSKMGRALKEFLGGAVTDARNLPGKAALRARIEEEFGTLSQERQDKLYNAYCELARRAADPASRWELGQVATDISARVAHKVNAEDRIVEPEAEEVIDVDAVVQGTDRYSDMVGGDLAREQARESAEAAELVRKANRFNP
jgi:hypothetical protein